MDQSEVKGSGPQPQEKASLSLSLKTSITILGALLIGGFIAVVCASWSVNSLKNQLVEQTRQKVIMTARMMGDEISQELDESDINLEEILSRQKTQNDFKRLIKTGEIAIVSVQNKSGQEIFTTHCSKSLSESQCTSILSKVRGENDLPPDMGMVIPVTQAIVDNGEVVGTLFIGHSRAVADARMNSLSSGITLALVVLTISVLLVMMAAAAVIVRIYRRHHVISQQIADWEHMGNMGTLTQGLAHEIKNPLHAMNLHLESVKEDLEDEEFTLDRKESVATISTVQAQIDRLDRIVKNFMNLSLPSKMDRRPMHLEELISEVVNFMRPEFSENQIEIEVDIADGMKIEGDPTALHQVLLNILLNSRQALESSPQKKIKVTGYYCKKQKKGWIVHIEDSGPGIPDGEEEQIFRQFVSKRAGGTGFGLSLARQIIQGHDGLITASRSSQLGGARISIKFCES